MAIIVKIVWYRRLFSTGGRTVSKLIAIVGATGAQGGGLARAILDDPQGGSRCAR